MKHDALRFNHHMESRSPKSWPSRSGTKGREAYSEDAYHALPCSAMSRSEISWLVASQATRKRVGASFAKRPACVSNLCAGCCHRGSEGKEAGVKGVHAPPRT